LHWNNKFYSFQPINLGCSQGTVGGPNIFSIMTDDLRAKHDIAKIIKYSDDSTIIVPCYKNPDNQQQSHLQSEFNNILNWSEINFFKINMAKSKQMRFSLNYLNDCQCNDVSLANTNSMNILGIKFQANCNFTNHVHELIGRLKSSLYVLKDLRLQNVPTKHVNRMFDSIILSRIRYGISVYGSDDGAITRVDKFLDSCFRYHFTTCQYSARNLLAEEDTRIGKSIMKNTIHPLHAVLDQNRKKYQTRHNYKFSRPMTNTIKFQRSFCNRVLCLPIT